MAAILLVFLESEKIGGERERDVVFWKEEKGRKRENVAAKQCEPGE